MSLGPTELISWEQTMMEYRSWVEEEKLKELKEEKENEEAEESLVTTSPVDLDQNNNVEGHTLSPWRRGRWNHLCRIAISKKLLCIHS